MKKIITYLFVFAFVVITAGFIIVKYKKTEPQNNALYAIQERTGPAARLAEWASTKSQASILQEAIKKNSSDNKSKLALVALFIQEARITGNGSYYNAAALKYLNDVLQSDPSNFEALIYKAIVQLSQHRFEEGLATAQQAKKINPYNAFVYGLMIDANVELGNYAAAVEHADKMVSIRPDLRSYSRIAYLREIHGDIPGAVDALKLAIEAGRPGHEGTEWCRVQLGQLYEQLGEIKNADLQYQISLQERPGYAYALAGLARIAIANKDYEQAIEHYKHARDMMDDHFFTEKIAEVYQLAGQQQRANAWANEVIHVMTEDHHKDDKESHADLELAEAWLTINNVDKALEHAVAEFKRRPDNIDVNRTLAWVYYRKGEFKKALPHIKTALKTNCKNPTLVAQAGLIYYKAQQIGNARSLLAAALKQNPNISPALKAECSEALKQLID